MNLSEIMCAKRPLGGRISFPPGDGDDKVQWTPAPHGKEEQEIPLVLHFKSTYKLSEHLTDVCTGNVQEDEITLFTLNRVYLVYQS